MKLNSNTHLLDNSDYKELEIIISKIALENKIDNVENIHCTLTKKGGDISFNISRDKKALSFGDIIMNISDVVDDFKESGGITGEGGLVDKGLKWVGGVGDSISNFFSGKQTPMLTDEQMKQQRDISEEYARGESLANKEQKEREDAAKKPVQPTNQAIQNKVPATPIKTPEVAQKPYQLSKEEQKEVKSKMPYQMSKEEQAEFKKQNAPYQLSKEEKDKVKSELPQEEIEESKRQQAYKDQWAKNNPGKPFPFQFKEQSQKEGSAIKINSNTVLLDESNYKILENIIFKIASRNNISNVENIHCTLDKNGGNLKFIIKEAAEEPIPAEHKPYVDAFMKGGPEAVKKYMKQIQPNAAAATINQMLPDVLSSIKQYTGQSATPQTPGVPKGEGSSWWDKAKNIFSPQNEIPQQKTEKQQGTEQPTKQTTQQKTSPLSQEKQNEIVNEIKQKYETGGKDAAMAYLMDPNAKGGGYQVPAAAEQYLNQLSQMGLLGKPGGQEKTPVAGPEEAKGYKLNPKDPEDAKKIEEIRKQYTPYKPKNEEELYANNPALKGQIEAIRSMPTITDVQDPISANKQQPQIPTTPQEEIKPPEVWNPEEKSPGQGS